MKITSVDDAFTILNDHTTGELDRVNAVRYLAHFSEERVLDRLVKALQEDDYGVRWEASVSLTRLGKTALPGLLRALMDPKRVGDPRLRRGAFRVLNHIKEFTPMQSLEGLIEALQGSAADVASMEAAYKVMTEIEAQSKKYHGRSPYDRSNHPSP